VLGPLLFSLFIHDIAGVIGDRFKFKFKFKIYFYFVKPIIYIVALKISQ
jgi:hypothetical protein